MYRLVLAWRVFAERPVTLVASRDGRDQGAASTRPFAVLRDDPRAVASQVTGVEETVLGYNEHGLVAFVRWRSGARRTISLRDVLGCRSADEAARRIERSIVLESATDEADLLVFDANTALSIETGSEVAVNTLTPGVHVFVGRDPRTESDRTGKVDRIGDRNAGNEREARPRGDTGTLDGSDPESGGKRRSTSDRPDGRAGTSTDANGRERAGRPQRFDTARWLYETLAPEPGERSAEWLIRARAALGDHEHGVCVHRPPAGHAGRAAETARGRTDGIEARIGTQSGASLAIDGADEVAYRYADGPPCSTPFRPVNPLP